MSANLLTASSAGACPARVQRCRLQSVRNAAPSTSGRTERSLHVAHVAAPVQQANAPLDKFKRDTSKGSPLTDLPRLTPELAAQDWDAVVIGSGVGGLTTATQLAVQGQKVLVLERYIIPGGSAGQFEREGYKFDVGSSMMFGLHEKAGSTNLITRALKAVGKAVETIPDPTQLEYHLPASAAHPEGLDIKVWCDYEDFLTELTRKFPHEKVGIRGFYDECWKIFNALNSMELKSLEEIKFLMSQFVKQPLSCLTLAAYFVTNTGEVARKHIKDEELLHVIDIECFCWSTVRADLTPLINTGMVLCDRFYGGVNYPVGGVGEISRQLAAGLVENGGSIVYKANCKEIITTGEGENQVATGVRMVDGTVVRARTVVSNATRWDTFGGLLEESKICENERKFRKRYTKAPSFISMHLGVDASVLPADTECHHIVVEDWEKMEDARGTLFVSIPSLLDRSLAPEGQHTFHAFAPEWIEEYDGMTNEEYVARKEAHADDMIDRLEARCFPGLRAAIRYREVGTPRTHAKFLGREDGTYGPVPMRPPKGILNMPFNSTDIAGLYCVGDSTFPGQGVNAVVFSGFGCAHRARVDMGEESTWPVIDKLFVNAMKAARFNT